MTNLLTNQEKIDIVKSHQKNISFNQYNLQINLIEENAKVTPSKEIIDGYNIQIADIQKQLDALDAELASLSSSN